MAEIAELATTNAQEKLKDQGLTLLEEIKEEENEPDEKHCKSSFVFNHTIVCQSPPELLRRRIQGQEKSKRHGTRMSTNSRRRFSLDPPQRVCTAPPGS